ncbi:hypothetical protein NIES2119_08050 [[Phormidium ambiguum] IAM M-71]|uniref:Uncharacterized protein n=1 Tax=[Phormidium ambiguum] IAM M-71 TaxID=454136 RepID=A0A1U7IP75_9CYAN|nr:hypothetical protein [Phormidium ambiguum]OKH39072.1 hypothetical protein NIES2119_08050 [Phormidium ambiguum IAM M-71]
MKIKRIGYGCTVTTGSYENKKYYVEADVEDWEDPEETYSALIEWTNKLIKREDEYKDLKRLVGNAESKLGNINYSLRSVEKQWDAIETSWGNLMTFLKANDLNTEEFERRFPSRPDFSPVGVKNSQEKATSQEVDEIPFDQSESLENEF